MRAELSFELLGYWHAGTGRGDGERADAMVQRTAGGLPFLPGRTVKGLLRATAEVGLAASLVKEDELKAWFGSPLLGDGDRVRDLEEARFATEPGALRFSSATLGPVWEAWASEGEPDQLAPLFATLASTAIDEQKGVARERTLRTIEVAVPMTLVATVEGPEGRWPGVFRELAPFLRSLGSGRNRGLGRVSLTVKEVP